MCDVWRNNCLVSIKAVIVVEVKIYLILYMKRYIGIKHTMISNAWQLFVSFFKF